MISPWLSSFFFHIQCRCSIGSYDELRAWLTNALRQLGDMDPDAVAAQLSKPQGTVMLGLRYLVMSLCVIINRTPLTGRGSQVVTNLIARPSKIGGGEGRVHTVCVCALISPTSS